MVPVFHRDASVLFDPGSTYSYVSSYFAPYLDISHDFSSFPIYVCTPMGDSIIVDREYRLCLAVIGAFKTRFHLLLLSMVYFKVILGVDWLSPHHAILDYHAKTATLAMQGLPGYSAWVHWIVVEKGCDAYLAFVRDVGADTPTVESVLVVRDFPDVFLVDLPSMPPDRDIDFGIDMLSGTQPISIPPYRMALGEFKELKE
ncbi:uncharacterized protein [Nicotiana tomentosiformis]|uniref:uncharacterized protein n=1 Tax=Nicotiana tomentosiformis TaxID=4098 RepID=UPI00388CE611